MGSFSQTARKDSCFSFREATCRSRHRHSAFDRAVSWAAIAVLQRHFPVAEKCCRPTHFFLMLFDISELLHPITDAQPSGPDMLLTTDFDEIQSARQQEDMSLDQGEWVTDRKEADLPFVVQRCTQLLRESTKDLRLAIWLTDAAASQVGLQGLTQGYALLNALLTRYWDSVHPEPEDGDMSARVGNISWLLKRTIEQLERAPLLQTDSAKISMINWQTAVALDQAVRRNPSEASDILHGKTTLEELERIRAQVPSQRLQALGNQLSQCRTEVEALESTLDAQLGDEAPSFTAVRETLDQLQHLARRWGAHDDSATSTSDSVPQATAEASVSNPQQSGSPAVTATHVMAGPIHTRADAIHMLQQVSAFFERTEPSSPAAYMAQKAARWAQLPLHEWLKHVVKSDEELAQLEEMLGVSRHARVAGE